MVHDPAPNVSVPNYSCSIAGPLKNAFSSYQQHFYFRCFILTNNAKIMPFRPLSYLRVTLSFYVIRDMLPNTHPHDLLSAADYDLYAKPRKPPKAPSATAAVLLSLRSSQTSLLKQNRIKRYIKYPCLRFAQIFPAIPCNAGSLYLVTLYLKNDQLSMTYNTD